VKGTEAMLFARTAAQLRPGQIAHRGRLRAQRAALRRWPHAGRRVLAGPAPTSVTGWPVGYRPLDARVPQPGPTLAKLRAGQISLLGTTRAIGDWQHPEAPQLWRYHLHYWDWAWALAVHPDRTQARAVFARLWRSWQEACVFGRPDAWLPYPVALRAWSWCGLHADLVAGSDLEGTFAAELAAHAGFLRANLESDVGGNHLIKNLKALAGLAVFFADDRMLRRAIRRLVTQVSVQVLPDGGHYERAPAYHCQVLADLMDVAALIQAAGGAPEPALTAAITRMRRWLSAVLCPDGQVPLLNDGYPVAPGVLPALDLDPPPAAALVVLRDTGLVRAQRGGWWLLADVGLPCPGGLPAHAHADTLGCVVHVDGVPLLVDTGTSTYAAGPRRDYERSTAAHNTVEVDGASSTQVWGAFRAARLARVRGLTARDDAFGITVQAAHDGFRRLPGQPVHHRRWALTDGGLQVQDLVTGSGRHSVAVRWHFAPGTGLLVKSPSAQVTTPAGVFEVTVTATSRVTLSAGSAPVAAGFGRTTQGPVLTCQVDAELPARIIAGWRRSGDSRPDEGAGRTAARSGTSAVAAPVPELTAAHAEDIS
jgi:uncharacterized heparinase superfamily protein